MKHGMDPLTVGQLIATLKEKCDDLDTVDVAEEDEGGYIIIQQHNDSVIRLEIQTS